MSKTYIINEEVLKDLIESHLELLALQDAGVDNWKGYSDAINESEDWSSNWGCWNVDKYIKDNNIKELH